MQAAKALHVSFPSALSATIRAEAQRRRVRPNVLVLSVMSNVIDSEIMNEVFEDWTPETVTGHRRHINGLTHIQCAALALISDNMDVNGTCWLSPWKIGHLCGGISDPTVRSALRALEGRGLIVKRNKMSSNGVQPWSLTCVGRRVAEELSASFEPKQEASR